MLVKVIENINRNRLIKKGEKVMVGVSGGPDSICLLHVLFSLKDELEIEIIAVHINHMLRGAEADADEEYVKSFCEESGIEFRAVKADVSNISKEKRISTEEAGRFARYKYFKELSAETGASKIAVAHNLNDQAETVIMNIIRGTGIDGLKGMDFKRGKIVRPLLNVDRQEIEDYCKANNLKPRTDESNYSDVYTRNKVRLKLIPYMNKLFNTDTVAVINKMSSLVRDDSEYLDIIAEQTFGKSLLKKCDSEISLDILKLAGCHASILKRTIRFALNELKGNLTDVETIHIESIVKLILSGKTGSVIQLPAGIRALREYKDLKLYFEKDVILQNCFEHLIKVPGNTLIESQSASVKASLIDISGEDYNVDMTSAEKIYKKIKYNEPIQYFDYDKIKDGIYIRNRRDGDLFKPLKSTGTKKLKEYFIDKKVAKNKRDGIPLVAEGNMIIWVVGYKINDNYKVDEKTERVLKLEYCI